MEHVQRWGVSRTSSPQTVPNPVTPDSTPLKKKKSRRERRKQASAKREQKQQRRRGSPTQDENDPSVGNSEGAPAERSKAIDDVGAEQREPATPSDHGPIHLVEPDSSDTSASEEVDDLIHRDQQYCVSHLGVLIILVMSST